MKYIIIILQALLFTKGIEIYIEALHYQYALWRKNKKKIEEDQL